MLDFDLMLREVGEFGLYQKILFVFQAPFCIFVTFVLFGQLFMTNPYPRFYWCNDTCVRANMTPEQRVNLTVPVTATPVPGFPTQYDFCRYYPIDSDLVTRLFTMAENTNCTNMTAPCPIVSLRSETHSRSKRQQYFMHTSRPRSTTIGLTPRPPSFVKTISEWTRRTTTTLRTITIIRTTSQLINENEISTTMSTLTTTTKPQSSSPSSPISSAQILNFGPTKECPNGTIEFNFFPFVNASIIAENVTRGENINFTLECNQWDWNKTEIRPETTIVTSAAGWLCDPEGRIFISQAVFFLGAIFGGIMIGYIADKFGRIPALVIANMFGCLGGALTALGEYNFILFCVFRFFTGFAFDNCFTMMYILVLEYVGPNYRTLVANLSIAVFYTIGTIILPWLAVLIGNWRIYALAISLPMIIGLAALFIVPESARFKWLLSKGRITEATDILRKFAKVNGKNVDETTFLEFEQGAQKLYDEMREEEEVSLAQALKRPKILKNFILLTLIWSLIAVVYDGHSRNVLNLGDNINVMFSIASSTEFPADVFLIFTLDVVGRRWMAFGSLILSGAFSFISATIPRQFNIAALVMAMGSRFWVNVGFNIGLQYAAELLPTVIRAQGVNFIHILISYVASIISPLIALIGRSNPALSLTLLGAFSIAGGVLSLFLPETLGEDLPNTLEEGESFGKNQSFWNCPICRKVDDEFPAEEMLVPPPTEEESRVRMRNSLMRASIRGETWRSSIISSGTNRGGNKGELISLRPSGDQTEIKKRYTT